MRVVSIWDNDKQYGQMKIRRLKRKKNIGYLVAVSVLSIVLWVRVSVWLNRSTSKEIIKEIERHVLTGDLESKCDMFFNKLNSIEPNLSIMDNLQKFEQDGNLIESISKIKIYNKCYLNNDFSVPNNKLEKQLYPFFHTEFKLPNYEPANKPGFPLYDKGIDFVNVEWDEKLSYWKNMQSFYQGDGIAITISTGQTVYLIRLLKVLLFLQNELPIQIIHKQDLSPEVRKYILDNSHGQKVLFVDVLHLLDLEYITMFKRFTNKWLAMLYSSFENVILMDVDSIPFIKPVDFLKFDEFTQTGELYFKDRYLPQEKLSKREFKLFKSMLKGDKFFDITSSDRLLFSHDSLLKHTIESGIVVMNKKRHLSGLLVSTVLQYWYRTSSAVYGDKELFWLGQQISDGSTAGEIESKLHPVNASIVGELQGDTICSTQIGHLDQLGQLLWMNGGLKNCKRPHYLTEDYTKHKEIRDKYASLDELLRHYESKFLINGSINPLKWEHTNECIGYEYCANEGELIKFDSNLIEFYKNLINIWNQNV